MAKIYKTFRFEASHSLTEHPGGCRNNHGHSYRAKVFLEGDVRRPMQKAEHHMDGMVVDLGVFDYYEALADRLDHDNLNDVFGDCMESTAENIAATFYEFGVYISSEVNELYERGVKPSRIELNETPRSGVTFTESDHLQLLNHLNDPSSELEPEQQEPIYDLFDEVIEEVDPFD